jgi:phage replication O-like protein O
MLTIIDMAGDAVANPQCENGHIDIANEIIEALAKYRLAGEEWQILLVVFRKTYGFHKKEDEISLSQFEAMTGMKRANVVRAIKKLVAKKILDSSKSDTTHATRYCFNKDYDKWAPSSKKATPVAKLITLPVAKKLHTKENSTKENIYSDFFGELWKKYPVKDGKKAALSRFRATVKSEEDCRRIRKALDNYLAHLKHETWKKPKNGDTWFNNWQDWEDWEECGAEEQSPSRDEQLAELRAKGVIQ